MARLKLETYWLRWKSGQWVLRCRRVGDRSWSVKWAAEAHARRICRSNWIDGGIPTRLNICDKKGRVVKEASYGADRKDRKG